MRWIAGFIIALLLSSSAWAQFNPPAGAQIVFPTDNFPIGGPQGATGAQTCSAACASTTLLNPIDATGYSGITIEFTSLGGGNVVTLQGSNDPGACSAATNWFGMNAYSATISPGATQPSSTMAATGLFIGPIAARCVRGQITTYVSGTITAEAFLRYGLPPLYTPYNAVTSMPPVPGNNGTSATSITCSGTGTTSATCTLAAVGGKTTYVCGVTMTESGGTAISAGGTITGTITGTLNYAQLGQMEQTYTPCVPASAVNTTLVGTTPTSTGATNSAIVMTGFQL